MIQTSSHDVAGRLQAAHIVVSTAALLAKYLRNGLLLPFHLAHIRYLVMDEADMLLAVAGQALRVIQAALPTQGMQVVLCSATLTDGVATMKGQLLHHPVSIVLSSTPVNDDEKKETKSRDRDTGSNTAKSYS
uniref:ATP-dependent rRNA helicase RRP3 n=1 Tax=Lygus hesperus TaxID=30085 RepID=A0A0A9YNS5_LYGHE